MPETTFSAALEQSYPRLFHRNAVVLRAFHAAVHAFTLRNWYIRRRLREIVDSLPRGATVVDVGCGTGDHVFYALRCRADLKVLGIDRSDASIDLCRAYAKAIGAPAEFIHGDADDGLELPPADLLLCITALQYVADDIGALAEFRGILRAGGRLLVYVPVRNRRLSSLYRRLVEESPRHYDTVQSRRRIYEVEEVEAKLEAGGFFIERSEQAYGIFGKIYFEMIELLLHGLVRSPWGVLLLPIAIVVSPALVFLMLLDFVFPVGEGNGLLLVAR
ncbi:MAG: class I SAM-dependent methyltransferase [Rhodothermales bacterium]